MKIYLVYGIFLEDIFSLRERVLELQKAQGPNLAPNPVKQAFFKGKNRFLEALEIWIFWCPKFVFEDIFSLRDFF